MNLPAFATRRRVTVGMFTVLALVFGLISLSELRVNLLPDLSFPTLTVRTEYPGAAPAEIERLLAEPIEEALGVVKRLKTVRSVSRTGQSDVILEFQWGTDMDLAGLEVREKLEVLQLPVEATRPLLLRFDPATDPILRVALASENVSDFDEEELKALRRFADEELKRRLEPVEGVAAVKISGGLEDEVQIDIDQQRVAQLGLSVTRIAQRLREENVNLSGGRLEEGTEKFLVRTINQFANVEEMADVLIANVQSRPIYLRDLASVKSGYKERQAIIRVNGDEAVEVAIYKEGDANTVDTADKVRAKLDDLRETLPKGLRLDVMDDQSVFIRQAIGDVVAAALIGGLLAILIIYLFLRDAWATVVIGVAIPVSIVATFFAMGQSGVGLNIMSLGGIALAAGLLVDNGIVVLENIARHRERGLSVVDAAVAGTREVSGAVTAATLTSAFVFLPLVFVEGIAGQLFRDQALTVTFALLISLIAALTLVPMMVSLKGRAPQAFADERGVAAPPRTKIGAGVRAVRQGIFNRLPSLLMAIAGAVLVVVAKVTQWLLFVPALLVNRLFDAVSGGYRRLLPFALNHRALVILVALAALGATAILVPRLGTDLIPQLAQGQFEAHIELAPGTPLAKTDNAAVRLQSNAMAQPGVASAYAISGTGSRIDANPTEAGENIAELLISLAPGASEPAVINALRDQVERWPGAEVRFSRPELFDFDTPLEIEISGFELEPLKLLSQQVTARLAASDRYADIESSLERGHPEIRIRFDQEKIASLGLTVREASDQVVRKVRGEIATRYNWRDRKVDVLVRAAEEDRASLADIRELIINPESARPVTLDAVAQVELTEGPAEIRRTDQQRVAVVSANLRYGDLGAAVEEARSLLAELRLPPRSSLRITGQGEEMAAAFNSLMLALALAVFLVYLVMASQFESLLHPLVILFSVPLAGVGAVLALYLTGTTLNVVAFIGLILLAGIVVNNAIVLVDRTNQLRDAGQEKRAAIIEAGNARLRPIVMTTLTTTLGLLPLALGIGEGAEVRAPMAITVIGGLLVSTLLTLVVIPVVYDLLDRGRRRQAIPEGAQIEESGVAP